ncbi:RNA 3'-terminal phosphate cyclase [Natrarchaeobius halalkaliphilus]|uniref:RNA 3'-terminal phosphate cyclase n=1 Tax=Natrarchaeobius halalkaliphilus TaxID=1679091 RepID=A0A3N6LVS5_9EURY|nr:RNA 3'-terminal phosphate cyclase [Natrarchaeobius halalkaliphilus]RQG92877.1 RNA 3'-terminal phosphate cyclase [Natrarchaeobius halalkaliphilus]
MTPVHRLDGSNAGGQFLRTALGLSVVRNESIRIENVRGDRSTPGLRHQHLAVLETIAEICDADVSGDGVGSETIEFDPDLPTNGRRGGRSDRSSPRRTDRRGSLDGGDYAVDIGTAGSITLLFDALVPLASVLESPLSVTVSGGTDVKWSPPIDYTRYVKLPLLRTFGLSVACEVDRRGFYPDGGGRATLHLGPSRFDRIELLERGPLEGIRLYSTEAATLSDRDVAHRQAEGALERLESNLGAAVDADRDGDGSVLEPIERRETTAGSDCPGTAIVLRLDYATGAVGFGALGERGTPAERVGELAADAALRHLTGAAPVDRHLADQLLVVLAIAGGRIRIPSGTDHVKASCDLLEAVGGAVEREQDGRGTVVSVTPLDG